jgi:3-dehydroquinate synthase
VTTRIEVDVPGRSYPVLIGSRLLDDATAWADAIRGRHRLIVSDSNVAPLYAQRLHAALEKIPSHPAEVARSAGEGPASVLRIDTVVLPAGEAHKNLAAAAQILDALARLGATRDACVLALGGGVVGDIAGFAAACWMRGIDFVQVPTTLLAMVDASVGGKTGVDHPAGKNLIGAFHQPRAVIADLDTLATLPERELRAGLAEVVKTACIGDAGLFAWLEAHTDALPTRDADALTHAIETCCRFKAGVVERDEREAGERALLNFGHTFGHAIEAEAGYGCLLHGEAVAIGMVLAARLSARLGLASDTDTQRLHGLLRGLGLPTSPPAGTDADALISRMQLDKKNRAGALRLILWRGIGCAETAEDIDAADVRAVLQEPGCR